MQSLTLMEWTSGFGLLVLLDVTDAALLVSQPFGGVVPAQLLDQLPGSAGDVSREVDGIDALKNDVVGLHRIGPGERRGAGQQLEHEHAERPIVRADVVTFIKDHFRRNILRGSAESPGFASGLELFREAEIDQLDISGSVKEQVFRFQVPVDDTP